MSVLDTAKESVYTDGISNVCYEHVDAIECADDDSIGLHEEVLRREDHVVVEVGNCFGEEVFDWLKDRHVDLHFQVVEKVTLYEAVTTS